MFAIVDYGVGNLHSVANAFEFLGFKAKVTASEADFEEANAIILPGVGSFGDGMANLRKHGLDDLLKRQVIEKKKPFLGICLGMQLIGESSEESPDSKGLGWIKGSVKKLVPGKGFRLPHIGWNNITPDANCPLFAGIEKDFNFYFVHGYALQCEDKGIVAATCDYGTVFTAAVRSGNIFATQFHPEKSHKNGLKLLQNFAAFAGGEKDA